MIEAEINGLPRLSRILADKAARLAEARIEERRLAQTGDAARWRRADLLWPTFSKGQ